MSWSTIGAQDDEPVHVVATGSRVHVTVGALPNESRMMLPRALAERLHAMLGEALAAPVEHDGAEHPPPLSELVGH